MTNIAKATVSRRRNEYGEFVVRAYDADGKRLPDGDYYTDDMGDAEATARAMTQPQELAAAGAELAELAELAAQLQELAAAGAELAELAAQLQELAASSPAPQPAELAARMQELAARMQELAASN